MKSKKEIEKELQVKIDIGNKRLAIVCCTMAFIISIPFMFLTTLECMDFIPDIIILFIYLSIICVVTLLSPKLVNIIYGD